MVPAAPAAVSRFSRLGAAWPREKAPISTAKNVCGEDRKEFQLEAQSIA